MTFFVGCRSTIRPSWSESDPRHYWEQGARYYCVTDRPVYRPLQSMHFKFWIRRAQYDQEDKSQFAGVTVPVEETTWGAIKALYQDEE